MLQKSEIVALAVALLVGCSSGRTAPALTEAWRLSSIKPIGQPVAVGDTVVVYGTEEQDLYLYGVAVKDGSVLWRQAASPSVVVSGISVAPSVIDDRVAYFRPDRAANLAARLVVARPDTGEDVLESASGHFTSHPTTCADGKDVCVTVAREGSRRFSVEAGGPVPDAGAPPTGSRFLGTDLLDLGDRDPEVLAGFQGGTLRWRSPLSRHFPAGHSSDEGWSFVLYRSGDRALHVGSVGRAADRSDRSAVVADLSKAATAAIDAATGSSVWRDGGTRFACDGTVAVYRQVADVSSEPWPVRCRYRGMARYDRATEATTYEGLDVTMEGFDVVTGKTRWSVPLGAAEAIMRDEAETNPVNDDEVLIRGGNGPVIVNLSNGSTRSPPADEVFWCNESRFFEYRESKHFSDGTSSNDWRGGTLLRPCLADGSETAETPTQMARSLGAAAGERTIVATAGGLVAYDRGRSR